MSVAIERGKFQDYAWIESGRIHPDKIFAALENEIVGTTMVVATFDGGSITPSDEEVKLGWYSDKGAMYAPDLGDIRRIPWDNYDEIYFFDFVPSPVEFVRFVNYGMFSMSDPKEKMKVPDPSWDIAGIENECAREADRQAALQAQILRLRPKILVMNGDNTILIYREKDLGFQVEKNLLGKI